MISRRPVEREGDRGHHRTHTVVGPPKRNGEVAKRYVLCACVLQERANLLRYRSASARGRFHHRLPLAYSYAVFALHSSVGEIFGQPQLLARIDDNRNAHQRVVRAENILAVPIIGRLLGHHHLVKLERAAC